MIKVLKRPYKYDIGQAKVCIKCIPCGSFISYTVSEDENEDTEDLEFQKFYGGVPTYIVCPCCGRKIIVGETLTARNDKEIN